MEAHDQGARDAVAPAQRSRECRNLAPAIGSHFYVVRKQRLEPSEIAVFYGREEPSCQLAALFSCRLEAGPTLLDVASCTGGELTRVVLALAHDRRDLRIPVVEHVVKQQHGTLLGRE